MSYTYPHIYVLWFVLLKDHINAWTPVLLLPQLFSSYILILSSVRQPLHVLKPLHHQGYVCLMHALTFCFVIATTTFWQYVDLIYASSYMSLLCQSMSGWSRFHVYQSTDTTHAPKLLFSCCHNYSPQCNDPLFLCQYMHALINVMSVQSYCFIN